MPSLFLMRRIVPIAIALLAVLLGGYAQYAALRGDATAQPSMGEAATTEALPAIGGTADASAAWVCPMHPQIVQDHPGDCPICGMDLVETGHDHAHTPAGVVIDTATRQRLGVRLATAEVRELSRDIRTYGEIAIDQSAILNITPKVDGWIRRLHATAEGQAVQAGDPLYAIYSPELVQRQREYIELLARRDQLLASMTNLVGQNARVAASLARERIRLREQFGYADVDHDILDALDDKRRTVDAVTVRAPRAGYVAQLGVREGDYVTPATRLLSLADATALWIDFELYPDQLAWVREGDAVEVRAQNAGRLRVRGTLQFASPAAEGLARTRKARLALRDPRQRLAPGTLADVVIHGSARTVLAVPRSAIIRTGSGARVMLSRGDGHFLPVPVETGLEADEFVEIVDGLDTGAEVAVNGQFLLDAAASLNDSIQRLRSDH